MGKKAKRRQRRMMRLVTDNAINPLVFDEYGIKVEKMTPMRRAFRLDTDKGVFGFKKEQYSFKEMEFIYRAIEHLAANGFPHVSRFKKTIDGKPFFVDQDGSIYFMTYWVNGKASNYERLRDVLICSRSIAQMHLASRGFSHSCPDDTRNDLGTWPEKTYHRAKQLKQLAEEIKDKAHLTRFERIYLKEWKRFYEQAKLAQILLKDSPYEQVTQQAKHDGVFCHHDLAYHNILIDNGVGNFIDFEYCLIDTQLHDLTSFIIRNMKQNDWNIHLAAEILDAYHQIWPIKQRDLQVMLAFLSFPQDFWQVSFTYFCENIGRSEGESVKRLQRAIKNNGPRKRFLEEFAKL